MPELLVHAAGGECIIPFEGTPLLFDLISHLPDAPLRSCAGSGKCGACAVIAQGSLSHSPDAYGKVLSCQTRVQGDAQVWLPGRQEIAQIEVRRQTDAYPLEPVAGQYGAAVDLGTTTIVLELIRLTDGQTLSVVSCENPQRVIAADVIGRIEHALGGGLAALSTMVRECIATLERKAFEQAGLRDKQADCRVIAGNTTMLYLYAGYNPISLSAAPFEADCLFGKTLDRDELPPCCGAFVGADITCALLSSRICEKNETALLIDIGTNGEIALWHQGQLTCCATAAGPAFEGCGISCGVGSIPGAIDSVCQTDGQLAFTTIAHAPACGLCGSGLIDLIAALLDTEQLDETGFLEDEVVLAPEVTLTQQDVRQVQLAKAAIAAGIETLLQNAGLNTDAVSTLFIAGGFGSHLNLQSAARIGLIPESLAGKAVILGNASLAGARQLLLSSSSNQQANAIAHHAECVNLASVSSFTNAFVEKMLFEA